MSVLLVAACFGFVLVYGGAWWPIRAGLLGAIVILTAAVLVRRRWLLLADTAPGSPERELWVSLAGHAVVAAHMATSLWQIGPDMVMHTAAVHTLGVDSWTLVGAAVAAWWIARDPQPRADERDQWIASRGLRAAHYGLLVLLLALLLALGFSADGPVAQLSRPGIAHLIILAILLSVLIDAITRLRSYAQDAALEQR
jgi:hypothetical protein